MSATAVANQADAKAAQSDLREPNQYHLSGEGIAVAYYPNGIGPIMIERGPICFVYQDAYRAKSFTREEVRIDQSSDLGTIVSVTLQSSIDAGGTTFSVLLPAVRLPAGLGSASPIKTVGITTTHRTFLAGPGPGQQENYSVAQLAGDARIGILPLAKKEG
jgi:hypothetical protein